MRILFASLVAMAAVAIAAPSFAQETATATPAPAPATATKSKAKPGTAAYCNTLKSDTSKSACLKRLHAQATPAAAPAAAPATKSHKTKKSAVKPADTSASLNAPPTLANPVPAQPQSTSVPALPQKTI